MLQISASPYQSQLTVVYQRLTVIVSDALLYYAISQFVQARASWYESYTKSQRQLTLVSQATRGGVMVVRCRSRRSSCELT
jgi:hypothetical protein